MTGSVINYATGRTSVHWVLKAFRARDNPYFHFIPPLMHSAVYTGDVVYGRADVYFESFFIKKYNTNSREEDVDFTVYFNFDRVCVVAPKALKVPKCLRIYHFFPLSIWIGTTLAYIVTCVTWYFLQTFAPGRYNIAPDSRH